MKVILPLLYLFYPSRLDDISRPVQELALAPYEPQRGIIYGIKVCASLAPIMAVFCALIPASRPRPPLAELMLISPTPKPKQEQLYKLSRVTLLQDTCPLPVFPTRPTTVETAQNSPLQPTGSSLDAPDLTSIPKMNLGSPITSDPVPYSPNATVHTTLASNVILLFSIAFVLLLLRRFFLVMFNTYNGRTPVCSVLYWLKIFLGVASCGILGNYQLPMDANPQGALLILAIDCVLREMDILGMVCSIGRLVCSWSFCPVLFCDVGVTSTDSVHWSTRRLG